MKNQYCLIQNAGLHQTIAVTLLNVLTSSAYDQNIDNKTIIEVLLLPWGYL